MPRELAHVTENRLVVGRVLEGNENALVHGGALFLVSRQVLKPRMVSMSSHPFNAATYASGFAAGGVFFIMMSVHHLRQSDDARDRALARYRLS